ncbi:MAG TPA: hypothetical protein VKM56_11265 [Verrucomicrobiae bacterium]|nr:hypothetical protein [Verrucomicrobiae bacterium]
MTIEAVREAIRNRRPFKVTMADGRTLEVPHAEFAALSRSGRLLYVMLEGDRTEALDVLLITGLEQQSPLPA